MAVSNTVRVTRAGEVGKKLNPRVRRASLRQAGNLTPDGLLDLHRTLGNAATARLARYLQMKSELTVGSPGDRYEREADAVADRIARGHLEDAALPFVRDGDLAAVATPLDFLGLNYYSRAVMRAGPDARPEAVKGNLPVTGS